MIFNFTESNSLRFQSLKLFSKTITDNAALEPPAENEEPVAPVYTPQEPQNYIDPDSVGNVFTYGETNEEHEHNPAPPNSPGDEFANFAIFENPSENSISQRSSPLREDVTRNNGRNSKQKCCTIL